ncbi:hypothetical protein BRARA_I04452 [Brassica rapa]|uniref:Uncharacterized protein n=1 Tax=Brassica campestris TaxID=3711 RepID=A0A397Y2T6_BRACM|nr:hypothetical protein BRARA_I04452 [Brassica rapa]
MFRRRVPVTSPTTNLRRHARGTHDRPTRAFLHHRTCRVFDKRSRAAHVNRHDAVEPVKIQVEDASPRVQDAGVAEENVELSVLLDGELDGVLHLCLLCYVATVETGLLFPDGNGDVSA